MITTSQPANQELLDALDAPFNLSQEQINFYSENGYIKLRKVLAPELLEHYRKVIHARVAELSVDALPMEQRSTYGKAFLQIMNLWTQSADVKEFVFGKRLARIAAELMKASGVRIYHDQALYKEAGGGITPWHADQYYWPVDSDKTITAWIPLQDTQLAMGPLAFCEKSHRFQIGRDLEISDESEVTLKQALHNFRLEETPFDLGDVSFHSGWTFHRAGSNATEQPREVMTMIYMDENIRLTAPKNKNHIADIDRWVPGLHTGDILASPLNPVIYSSLPAGAEIA
ncbi:MAG: phytanoyl-CoA dioxygenase family protein [Acidobacteriota bacterium]|nr:phytanoyl-CoA dioxygenase family protein [Acidobacteriota bacterium]